MQYADDCYIDARNLIFFRVSHAKLTTRPNGARERPGGLSPWVHREGALLVIPATALNLDSCNLLTSVFKVMDKDANKDVYTIMSELALSHKIHVANCTSKNHIITEIWPWNWFIGSKLECTIKHTGKIRCRMLMLEIAKPCGSLQWPSTVVREMLSGQLEDQAY